MLSEEMLVLPVLDVAVARLMVKELCHGQKPHARTRLVKLFVKVQAIAHHLALLSVARHHPDRLQLLVDRLNKVRAALRH